MMKRYFGSFLCCVVSPVFDLMVDCFLLFKNAWMQFPFSFTDYCDD